MKEHLEIDQLGNLLIIIRFNLNVH